MWRANLYLREEVIVGRVLAQLQTLTSRDTAVAQENVRRHAIPMSAVWTDTSSIAGIL